MFVCNKRFVLLTVLLFCWQFGVVDGCSVTDSSGQTFSARDFATQNEGVEYKEADDSLSCGGFLRQCWDVTIRNCATLSCGIVACLRASLVDIKNVICADHESCGGASISGAVSVKCSGQWSCQRVAFADLAADAKLEFSGRRSGVDATGSIENISSILCGLSACPFMAITNITYVDCVGSGSCYKSTISGASQVNCDGQSSCSSAMIVDLPDNGGVNCQTSTACQSSVIRKSDNVAGNKILVHCAGPWACSSYHERSKLTLIDVGKGTVACQEGNAGLFVFGACVRTDITSGCLECVGEQSCSERCFYSNSTVQNITCPQDSQAGNCSALSFDFLVGPCDYLSCGTGGSPVENCDAQVNRCELPDFFGIDGDRCEAPDSSTSNRAAAQAKGKKKSEKKAKSKKNKKDRMEVIPGCSCAFPLD